MLPKIKPINPKIEEPIMFNANFVMKKKIAEMVAQNKLNFVFCQSHLSREKKLRTMSHCCLRYGFLVMFVSLVVLLRNK